MTAPHRPPRSKFLRACAAALAPGMVAGAALGGDPVLNPDNGRSYMAVEAQLGISWEDARLAAEALEHAGVQGHLATLTSAEENQFIVDNLPSAAIDLYWIGGVQSEGEADPSAGWSWVTGESWEFTNWDEGEPNDALGAEERFLILWRTDWGDPVPAPDTVLGRWNDDPAGVLAAGFVVEFPAPPACPIDLAEPPGTLDFSDVLAFLSAYGASDPAADLAEPFGVWDFSDVFRFLSLFGTNCQ